VIEPARWLDREPATAEFLIVEVRSPFSRTAPRKCYGADIWHSGHDYLLYGDGADFKALRVAL
jgi:hypothetical protein